MSIESYPGETAIISGGRALSGEWKADGGLLYVDIGNPVPYYFKDLYKNTEKLQRARKPNADEVSPNQVQWRNGAVPGHEKDAISYFPGQISPCDNQEDVMLNIYQLWLASQHWITEVNTAGNYCRFIHPTWFSQEAQWYWNERVHHKSCIALIRPGVCRPCRKHANPSLAVESEH